MLPSNELGKLSEALPISEERNIHKSLADDKEKDLMLPTNPMELMNIIRRASAMEDATSPSDAIDQALKAFDEQNPAKIN